jgi:hypothetical protein
MVKRFAAHYIVLPPGYLYKLHVIEIDENRGLGIVYPLKQETAATVFLNGLILAVNENTFPPDELLVTVENHVQQYPGITLFELLDYLSLKKLVAGEPLNLYHLDGIDLPSAKFRTDNSRSNRYIQRIC